MTFSMYLSCKHTFDPKANLELDILKPLSFKISSNDEILCQVPTFCLIQKMYLVFVKNSKHLNNFKWSNKKIYYLFSVSKSLLIIISTNSSKPFWLPFVFSLMTSLSNNQLCS